MKLKNQLFLLALSVVLFVGQSCDFIKGPKKDYSQLSGDSERIVLLEDYTGHACGNCPRAAEMAAGIDTVFEGNVVIMAVHVGIFASTTSWGPKYTNDFKTESGNAWETEFAIAGLPKGMVNRKEFDGSYAQDRTNWTGQISGLLAENSPMILNATTVWDEIARKVDISVDIEYLLDGTADDALTVVITEDSIISTQKDYSLPAADQDIEDYVHRHMMRGAVTGGHWGETLDNAPKNPGARFTKTYTYTLPPEWEAKHCHVIAFVAKGKTDIYEAVDAKVVGGN